MAGGRVAAARQSLRTTAAEMDVCSPAAPGSAFTDVQMSDQSGQVTRRGTAVVAAVASSGATAGSRLTFSSPREATAGLQVWRAHRA